jgi:A/G-specific adenine glycosylase
MSPASFCHTLLDWYLSYGRDLPWRHTHDPYAIWLSEVILQQTRISQGTAYWQRFMQSWPTVDALAAGTEDEVLKMWQGLGYYSRARNLHTAAQQIVAMGQFPHTLDEIRKLKGVGDYTAAAIASMAFGVTAAAVDGNVYRVLSRFYAIDSPINSTEGKHLFARLADELVHAVPRQALSPQGEEVSGASLFNQAMMDFGATQCTPQSPSCMLCPFAEDCEAHRQGIVERLPVKLKKIKITTRHLIYIYVRTQGYTAIHRRGAGDIWQGLWEPPLFEDQSLPQWPGHLRQLATGVKHVLTHRILMADFYVLDTDVRPSLPEDYIWVPETQLGDYAVPRLVEKLLTEYLSSVSRPHADSL